MKIDPSLFEDINSTKYDPVLDGPREWEGGYLEGETEE